MISGRANLCIAATIRELKLTGTLNCALVVATINLKRADVISKKHILLAIVGVFGKVQLGKTPQPKKAN